MKRALHGAKIFLCALPLSIALSADAHAQSSEPWFRRPACAETQAQIFSADFAAGEKSLSKLEASKDPDDRACALWLRALESEVMISVLGDEQSLFENRKKRLVQLFAFSKKHKNIPRFADLEYEARLRRIRVLIADGKRSDAIDEAKRVQKEIQARKTPATPSFRYSVGISNLAVGFSEWPVRLVLKLAGVSADKELGAKEMMHLYKGDTIYKDEAAYVLRAFAEEQPGDILGRSIQYSKDLYAKFPTNPQFLFDYTGDLLTENRCDLALKELDPALKQIKDDPKKWSNKIRAKLFWLAGRCSLKIGDANSAKTYLQLAKEQRFDKIKDKLEALEDDL